MMASERDASSRRAGCVVVAPLSRELRPLVRRIGGRRVGSLPTGAVFSGRWADREVLVAVLGDGAARFRSSLVEVLVRHRPRRILLVGVAGGLSPELGVGDLVRAARVVEVATAGDQPAEWTAPSAAGTGGGTVVAAERIVGSRRDKERLWRRLGGPARAVVDLESAAFARLLTEGEDADGSGAADWAILRAVIDPQGEDLPLDFDAASDAGGHVVGSRVARQLVASPGAVGALRELKVRVALCADRLATAALEWVEEPGA